MKINSLQNISLNSKQKILDRNIRFYVQNYADHFSKGQNITFKGKEDEEKYLLDYRNIAINDEYLDKLSDGRAVKQTATIINFDRLPEINIEEMFEKAKKQGVYKAKLNAREILECEYYPKFNTYSIISYDGKNPKNQKILKGKAIEEQFLSCYDSICEIREDKETKNDRQFLNNLMSAPLATIVEIMIETSEKDVPEEEKENSAKKLIAQYSKDGLEFFKSRKMSVGEFLNTLAKLGKVKIKGYDVSPIYPDNMLYYLEIASKNELENVYINNFDTIFATYFYRNIDDNEAYQKEKITTLHFLKEYDLETKLELQYYFEELAEHFNDFETQYDIADLIDFLKENKISRALFEHIQKECQETDTSIFEAIEKRNYSEKIENLKTILGPKDNKNAEKIYDNFMSIIDSYWENNDESLDGIEGIISTCTTFEKTDLLKDKKGLITDPHKLKEAYSIISLIQQNELTISEYQAVRANADKGEGIVAKFREFSEAIEIIEENFPFEKKHAKEQYLKFQNTYNSFSNNSKNKELSIIETTNFIKNFEFKDEKDIRKVWNDTGLNLTKEHKVFDPKDIKTALNKANIYTNKDLESLISANKKNKGLISQHISRYSALYAEIENLLPKIEDETTIKFFKDKTVLEIVNSLSEVIFAMQSQNKKAKLKEILETIAKEEIYSFKDWQKYAQDKKEFSKTENLKNVLTQVISSTKDTSIKKHFKANDAEKLVSRYGFLINKSEKWDSKIIETYLRFAINFNIENEKDYQDFEEKYFSYNKGRNYALELEKIGIDTLEELEICKSLHPDNANFYHFIKSTDFKNLNSYIEEVKKENPDFANHLEKSGLDTPIKIYKNYDEIFKYFKHYHENCYKSALEFIQKNKILSNEDFENKTKEFKDELGTTQDVLKFIRITEFNLASEENKEFYLSTLRALKDTDKETTFRKIKEFADVFLKKSKNTKYSNDCAYVKLKEKFDSLEEFIKFLYDEKIPDIKSFNDYMLGFTNNKISMDNIVEHLIKMTKDKDMNFELYKTGVRKVRTGFARLKDDLNLSNKSYFLDITKLECKDFTDKCSRADFLKLISKLLDSKKDESIIVKLLSPYTTYSKTTSTQAIVREILNANTEGHDSYKNILENLEISHEYRDKNSKELSKEEFGEIIKSLEKNNQDFIDFINEDFDKILKEIFGCKFPNTNLHTKLRIVERVLLANGINFNKLNSKKTKEILSEFFSKIYKEAPEEIQPSRDEENKLRIIVKITFKGENWNIVFTPDGKLITVVNKDR